MKIKLLLLLLCFSLMSSTCEPEEQQTSQCDCEIQYYLYVPNVGGQGGVYQYQFSNPIEFDCINEQHGNYFQVSNVNYNYAKIICN